MATIKWERGDDGRWYAIQKPVREQMKGANQVDREQQIESPFAPPEPRKPGRPKTVRQGEQP